VTRATAIKELAGVAVRRHLQIDVLLNCVGAWEGGERVQETSVGA
jgi:hypothetical protein